MLNCSIKNKFLHQLKLSCLFILINIPGVVFAEFSIKIPCDSDLEITNNTGKKHKFYASMLAFNSEPPRCLKKKQIIALEMVEEAEITNDQRTNDVIVHILLTDAGKEILADYTTENPSTEVALMVDDKILAMLSIPKPILDGKLIIHGLWYEDAIRLSNAINQK